MQIEFPDRAFGGYIFDLDGTLIHSMPVHYRAWDQAMREAGIGGTLDEDLFYSLGGVPTVLVAERMAAHYGITVDAVAIEHRKEALYLEILHEVELIEPVVAFAREMAKTHPVAIATGGLPMIALPALDAAGLRDLFRIVVTPDDVAPGRGKPEPDMFLEAARRMGVAPENCLVFEDADPGIAAAQAAGMAVVRVPSRT
ncbi:HAD family hydrolase [Synoicihabitans lomoniglobus]|uniref:HAD family phosphatase n=1 Tax=Synoicihabitans lomoniglobus TaxID=2909285 RepID=A0AAF0CPP5_9BACT|nr:HAD family phosphatase [Opitutaceae bacterium LMO-M01]WED65765.1 HAD family phosphatase [Opitutaceae bacterium LMO-M01]